ncbi:MAG: hypothetical protein AVDCRST_MAG77-2215 [uncultured Chloroflexi bacterium]|uniref:Uncharacterized protein n=1 Tax=uncultured Chloroflexota bacterium TaxID=166587 RepID=A0A6J4IIZ3_9CHLR|nr:MAG: hypothetical protein AVDCRST_MAG77-2215 [uncultured Chloroflexota bacterium]
MHHSRGGALRTGSSVPPQHGLGEDAVVGVLGHRDRITHRCPASKLQMEKLRTVE